jgi:hypothetical protein
MEAPAHLVSAVLAAWDQEFSRPAESAVDYRQARLAVETVVTGLIADGWVPPSGPSRPEPDRTRLSRLLATSRTRTFPWTAGELNSGVVDPTTIGPDICGWADQILAGSLSPATLKQLQDAQGRLRRSIPTFPDTAQSYFVHLLEIATLALQIAAPPTD